MEPTQNKTNGALIGSIIIIVILIIGGIYLLKTKAIKQEENSNISSDTTQIENSTSGDSIEEIEADLNLNADMESLDSGLE